MGGSSSKQIDSRKGKGKGRSHDQSIQEVAESRDKAIHNVQTLRAQFRDECSHPGCQERLSPLAPFEYDEIFDTWLAGSKTIPPTNQFSTWNCSNGHSTCIGCGSRPTFGPESFFTSLGVVNHCCNQGRLFAVWFLLAQFDKNSLESQANNEKKKKPEQAKSKTKPKANSKAFVPGVGYGADTGGIDGWSDEEMFMHSHMGHMIITGHPSAMVSPTT